MKNGHRELEAIEEALLELDAAEEAGLFQRTSLDTQRLLVRGVQPEQSAWRYFAWRLLPVAAALALVIGVSSWMFTHPPAVPRDRSAIATGGADPSSGSFYECFDGPSTVLSPGCQGYDYDADGDVDLADFGAFQLAFADTTR